MSIQMTSGSQARLGAALAAALAFVGGCVVGRATAPSGALVAEARSTISHVQKAWWDTPPTSPPPLLANQPPAASPKVSAPGTSIITPERFHELSLAAKQDSAVAWQLLQRLKDTDDMAARFTLVNVLNESQRPMLTAQIQQWMGSNHAQDRALAFELAQQLGEMPRAMLLEARKVILAESDPQVLSSALGAYRPTDTDTSSGDMALMAEQLRRLSQNQHAEVRRQSLSKLIEVDPSPAVEADLTRALQDPDMAVRITAIHGLVQSGVRNEAVTGELMRLSLDAATDGPLRVSAMDALRQFRLTAEQQRQLSAVQSSQPAVTPISFR